MMLGFEAQRQQPSSRHKKATVFLHPVQTKNLNSNSHIYIYYYQSNLAPNPACYIYKMNYFTYLGFSGFYTKLNVWGSLGLNFDYDGGPI